MNTSETTNTPELSGMERLRLDIVRQWQVAMVEETHFGHSTCCSGEDLGQYLAAATDRRFVDAMLPWEDSAAEDRSMPAGPTVRMHEGYRICIAREDVHQVTIYRPDGRKLTSARLEETEAIALLMAKGVIDRQEAHSEARGTDR